MEASESLLDIQILGLVVITLESHRFANTNAEGKALRLGNGGILGSSLNLDSIK